MSSQFAIGRGVPDASNGFAYVAAERRGRLDRPRGSDRPHAPGPWLWVTVSLAIVLVLSPLAAAAWYQYEHVNRVFRGVSTLGIDLSGMTSDQASEVLGRRALELTARPVLIRAGDQQWRTDWGHLGLQLPVEPIVDRAMAVGREGNLARRARSQVEALRYGTTISASESFYESALREFVFGVSRQIDRPVRNARLDMLPDLTFELTTAQDGRRLDPEDALRRLRWAADSGGAVVDLDVETLHPITTDEMRLPAKARAEHLVDGPLTLTFRDRSWTIQRRELADLLVFTGGPGVPINVQLNAQLLESRLEAMAAELVQQPRDGRVDWNAGAPRPLVPSTEGRELDIREAVRTVISRADGPDRNIQLPVRVTKPAVDTDEITRMGLRELIGSASTSIANGHPAKQHNVRLAASRLHGFVLPPGSAFSFNKALGPTTLDSGFKVAFGITSDGAGPRTIPSVAGGICQVATTLFQPVFWTGYQIEERHWHLYWIPAYASRGVNGLDATVDEEAGLDLRFANNTPDYLLIQARVDGGTLTFDLYGTKPSWHVSVDGPRILERQPADANPVVEYEPSLPDGQQVQVEAAGEGFTAVFVRTVADGSNSRTLRLESRYMPSRNVTLVGTGGRPAPPREERPNPIRPAA